jgi:hypothetical protein
MKKFFFSILAVGAMVACTKSEVKFEGETEIAFAPVTSVVTKAHVMHAIDGTEYPEGETFRVWGYWQLLDAGTDHSAFNAAKDYIQDGKVFAKADDEDLWRGTPNRYYWPKTGSIVFACLSPADAAVTNLSHDVVNDNFSFNYYSPNAHSKINLSETIDLMWTDATVSYNETTAAAGVPVTFKHALTWITFKVQGDAYTSNGGFVVKSITMNNVKASGDFTSSDRKWKTGTTTFNVPVFEGEQNLTADPVVIENVARGTLIIPQVNEDASNYTATIKFTNTLGDVDINEEITVGLGPGWEIGKHYTYTLKFTTSEILIEPHMEDWVEVDAGTQIF